MISIEEWKVSRAEGIDSDENSDALVDNAASPLPRDSEQVVHEIDDIIESDDVGGAIVQLIEMIVIDNDPGLVRQLVRLVSTAEGDRRVHDAVMRSSAQDVPTTIPILLGRLFTQRQDLDIAEDLYRRTVESKPRDLDILWALAAFLERWRSDLDAAEEVYTSALMIDSDNPGTLRRLGVFYEMLRKDPETAGVYFNRAIQNPDADASTLSRTALFLGATGETDRAEATHQRALRADPAYAIAYRRYGDFLWHRRSDIGGARELFSAIAQLDAVDGVTLSRAAEFFGETGEARMAQELFGRAVERSPGSSLVLRRYAHFLDKEGSEPELARVYFEEAVSAGSNGFTSARAAIFFAERGDVTRAKELFLEAVHEEPSEPHIVAVAAQFLLDNGAVEDGRRLLIQAAALAPQDVELAWDVAAQLEQRDELDEAESIYRRLLTVDPDNFETLRRYAVFQELYRDEPDRARELYEKAVSNPLADSVTLSRAAIFFAESGDQTRADELYDASISRQDTDPLSLIRAALNYQRVERWSDAVEAMQRAVNLDGDVAQNWYVLSVMVNSRGDAENDPLAVGQAEEHLKRAIALDPDNLRYRLGLAAFLEERGELDEAQRLYEAALEKDSSNFEILRRFAVFQELYRRDWDRARVLFTSAVELGDPDELTLSRAALFFERTGDFMVAARLLRRHPNLETNPDTALQLARVLVGDHRVHEAGEIVDRVTASFSDRPDILERAGYVFRGIDPDRVRDFWERAHLLSPDDQNLATNLAQVLLFFDEEHGVDLVRSTVQNAELPDQLRLEASIYALAHGLAFAVEAGQLYENLLDRGTRVERWDFDITLRWVESHQPDRIKEVRALIERAQPTPHKDSEQS